MKHRITLIPGDGIGPEVAATVVRIIEASGVEIEWETHYAGAQALEKFGETLPKELLESITRNKVALKGPVTTPIGKGFTSVNVGLRKALDLYANVRPVRALPNVPCRYPELNLVIVRENTESLYGDIVSDLCAGLIGGLGLVPGANIGEKGAVFEAVHGSAPDIAGQGIANPTALLQSGVLMLRHLGEREAADKTENAMLQVFAEGKVRTKDIGGTARTAEFADAIIQKMK